MAYHYRKMQNEPLSGLDSLRLIGGLDMGNNPFLSIYML